MLAMLLTPAAAYPLGLGDIRVNSGLNQPFSAEIDLLSVSPDDVPSIVASLASHDAFLQIGLERPVALMALSFSVEKRPNGSYFIKAVSEQPIREPFLDFLLEVNWRSGRLVREYTVLLDPPEFMKKEAPPAVRAPATTAARSGAGKAAPARAVAGSSKPAASTGPLTYGPVRENETLWSIANKLRPDASVSVPQVMMALLKGNPEAFEGNNVNRLKSGTVLRLDPALLRSMSRAQAAREVALQDREWQDFKQQVAAEAMGRTPSGEAAVPRSAASIKTEEPRLRLVAPETAEPGKRDASGTTGGTQALEDLKKELLLAQESAAASKQEVEELRQRLKELEGQIAAMERLLSLKDNDLAVLQRQLGKAAEAPAAASAPQAPEAAIAAQGGASEVQQASAETPAAEAPAAAPVQAEKTEAAQAEAPKPAKPKRPPAPPPPPPPEPTLFETLLANPLYSGLSLLLGVAVIALATLVIRRRRASNNFTESILMGGTPSMLKAKAAEGKAGEESSFFSDFAVSGMGDIQAEDSEVDPLTEADVYMAYQRYQQAEDLVKDALKHNPDRPELHVKLLEVYHATKDKANFEAEALKTHALLNGTGPLWDKVLVLGHELMPEHPLFAKAPDNPVVAVPDHADARLDNEVLDIGLDLDALTEEMESGGSDDFNLDLGVDFSDLEDLSPRKDTATPAQSAAAQDKPQTEASGFDLDLDALAADTAVAPPDSPATADAALDFDLSDLSLEEPATAPTPEAAPAFDLSELSLDEPATTPAQEATPTFDLNELSLEEPTATPVPASEPAFDLSELSLDESATTPAPEDTPEFDLGELSLDELTTESTHETPAFDLGEPSLNAPATETVQEPAPEFDLGELTSESADAPAEVPATAQAEDALALEDFNLDEFDLGTDAGQEGGAAAEPDTHATGGLNLADLDLAAEALHLEDMPPEQEEADDLLLDSISEVDTKLDLARAYVGMGDTEGARSLLDEVMQEGNDLQKQQAEELLKQIA